MTCCGCSGLEDQLLGIVVAEERPDLEEAKNQLIVSNAKMKSELKEIEDKILQRLSSSQGSPVDDVDLIKTLEASKIKSQEIKVRAPRLSLLSYTTLSCGGRFGSSWSCDQLWKVIDVSPCSYLLLVG